MTDMPSVITAEFIEKESERLGLTSMKRPGTVFGTNSGPLVLVTLDYDQQPTRCISLLGTRLATGDRVFVTKFAPNGFYVIGRLTNRPELWTYPLFASANTLLNLTTTMTLVPGCTITVTGVPDRAYYEADAVVDFEKIGTNANTTGTAQLFLNGSAVGSAMALDRWTSGVAGDRSTPGQIYPLASLTSGSNTFEIRAARVGGADLTVRANAIHTNLRVRIYL